MLNYRTVEAVYIYIYIDNLIKYKINISRDRVFCYFCDMQFW